MFLALPLAVLLGSMSPGPSFVVVARAAAADSRNAGVFAAIGMGVGSVVFSSAALMGVARLLQASPWTYAMFKVAGASYLIWLATKLWRTASEPLTIVEANGTRRRSGRRWFTSSLLAQITNPKTAVFYASVFASLLPSDLPLWAFIVLPAAVFAIETAWYTAVALVFSRRTPRRYYSDAKATIDRVAAAVLGALGIRLAADLTERVT